jgi:hypothetical protein
MSLLDAIASSWVLPILLLLQMAVQRAQRQTMTAAELSPPHPARTVQTRQPLYLRSTTTTIYHYRLSAHKQSPSQILYGVERRFSLFVIRVFGSKKSFGTT